LEILLEKNESLNANIKVKLNAADFQPRIEKKIKEVQKKAVLKGFRQGKVPMPVIKKMYGKSVTYEEISTLAVDSLNSYVEEQKLELVAAPVFDLENQPNFDFEDLQEVEFNYSIGFKPNADVKAFLPQIQLIERKIEFTEADIDEEVARLQKAYADYSTPEISEAIDTLIGRISKGEDSTVATVEISELAPENQAIFVGLKEADVISFDINAVFGDKIADFVKADADKFEGECSFQVNHLGRKSLLPLDQAFFEKVLGAGSVQTIEEFREELKNVLTDIYNEELAQLQAAEFGQQVNEKFEVEAPLGFYKKMIIYNAETRQLEYNDVLVEQALGELKNSFKNSFFREGIYETYQIGQASIEQIDDFIALQTRHRFFFMGVLQSNNDYVKEMGRILRTSKDEQAKKLLDEYLNAFSERRILGAIKNDISLEHQTIDLTGYKAVLADFSKKMKGE